MTDLPQVNVSNIERTISQVERWLVALDEQRDLASRHVETFGHSPKLDAWMASMEQERYDVLALLARLREMRHLACLIITDRPERVMLRQLKASLYPTQQRKEA